MRGLTRVLQFITLICVCLVFGLTLTHVLQAPGSRQLTGAEWLTVQHTFYGGFAIVGGACEIVGLVTAGALAVVSARMRERRAAAAWGIVCLSLIGTLIVFFIGNLPVNSLVAVWTVSTLPADWHSYRDTWENSHAISTVLSGVGFFVATATLVWPGRILHARERNAQPGGRL